ncbi:MAG: bifunctional DNA-formamidopyrimidine glycosylase/DNA-(apurinic or apyrimidinic site) lyase [Planctomycetota bacterium]|nr:bifunctional DNA-formamidopyrimidine glycosylase/DNA-(apurinic or apyrimidinic site) lyase [Planctomycetota bacterium]MDA1251387.1 bifunctional DNA-formamidopyrimidine glycosylase/DNA-(apurinic or apyrimidinic site) lyase [Planctomycetota bacterium]
MPELPEVETMVRGIRPHIEGRRIREVRVPPCRCRPLLIEPRPKTIARRVAGATVDRIWRRAKRVVLSLSTGDAFAVEPRMTGLMLVDEAPDDSHLRLEWVFEPSPQHEVNSLWFWDRRGLGTIRLLTPEEQAVVFGPDRLGTDALEMTETEWREVLSSTRTAIKVALLNQKRVAGIGNLYASEILHLSRISPEVPAQELSRKQISRLANAVPAILNEAIRYEGSTLGDGTYRNALNETGGYQNAHMVYAREGELCPTCRRGTIVRIVQAQRSTFFCRVCQRKPRSK